MKIELSKKFNKLKTKQHKIIIDEKKIEEGE